MGITLNSERGEPPPGNVDRVTADTTGAPLVTARAITVRGARIRRGARFSLDVDRLDIPTGVTALVGPNGCGRVNEKGNDIAGRGRAMPMTPRLPFEKVPLRERDSPPDVGTA